MHTFLMIAVIFFLLVAAFRDLLAILRQHPVFVGFIILLIAITWVAQHETVVSTAIAWIVTAIKVLVTIILVTALWIAIDECREDKERNDEE